MGAWWCSGPPRAMSSRAGSTGVPVSLLRAPKRGRGLPSHVLSGLSHTSHVSLVFWGGVSSLLSTTIWVTDGPSLRECTRTTTRHPPPSMTRWYVCCWHRGGEPQQIGVHGAPRGGGPARGLLAWTAKEGTAPGAAFWVGAGLLWGRSGPQVLLLVSLVPPKGNPCGKAPGPCPAGSRSRGQQDALGPPYSLRCWARLVTPRAVPGKDRAEAGAHPAPLPPLASSLLATAAAFSSAVFPLGAGRVRAGGPRAGQSPETPGQDRSLEEGEARVTISYPRCHPSSLAREAGKGPCLFRGTVSREGEPGGEQVSRRAHPRQLSWVWAREVPRFLPRPRGLRLSVAFT